MSTHLERATHLRCAANKAGFLVRAYDLERNDAAKANVLCDMTCRDLASKSARYEVPFCWAPHRSRLHSSGIFHVAHELFLNGKVLSNIE